MLLKRGVIHNKPADHKEQRHSHGAISKQDFPPLALLENALHVKETHQQSRHSPEELDDVEFGFHGKNASGNGKPNVFS